MRRRIANSMVGIGSPGSRRSYYKVLSTSQAGVIGRPETKVGGK